MANKNEIIRALNNNEVVIVPTDTVWGIAAKFSEKNSLKVAKTKGNVLDKKYSIMVSNKSRALAIWEENIFLKELVLKHMPGDLTIIAKGQNSNEYIGIRIPDDKQLLSIIEEVGPIIATSANLSGQSPLNTKEELQNTFPDLKILEGKPGGKKPSTIIKVENNQYKIIRQGDKVL